MKKLLLTVFVGLFFALVPAAAQTGNVAIGPVYSLNVQGLQSPINGLGFTGKIPGLAPVFGTNFSFGTLEANFFGLTADWIMYKQPLYEPFALNFFVGAGAYTSLYFANDSDAIANDVSHFDLGFRIPFGLNWTPVRFLEFFVDVVPAIGITFQAQITPGWVFQGETGARVWF